jgi:hypothetical protein
MRSEPQTAKIRYEALHAALRLLRRARFLCALAAGMLLTATLLPARAQDAAPPGLSESDIPAPAAAFPTRPVDLPPRPPQVSCSGDQMTINADNSTLDSILAEVQKCIGVRIDIPGGSDGQRTYLHLGPGPTRKVLLAFLESTDFNYVLQPSDSDPTVIRSVLLMARTDGTKDHLIPDSPDQSPTRRAWLDERRRAALSTRDPSSLPDSSADTDGDADPAQVADTSSRPPAEASETAASEPAASSAAAGDPAQSTDPALPPSALPASALPAATTSASSTSAAGSVAGSSISSGNQLQDQITNMQQMFEQRKRMAQSSGQAPSPQPQ